MGNKLTITLWFAAFLASAAIAILAIFAASGRDVVPTAAQHLIDRGPITVCIVGLFAIGLVINGVNTVSILYQRHLVSKGVVHVRLPNQERVIGEGLLGTHVNRLYEMYSDSVVADINQSSCLNSIRNHLHRREWIVRTTSNLLLTLGLIGTVLGLTDSLGGLSTTVNAVASESLNLTIDTKSDEPESQKNSQQLSQTESPEPSRPKPSSFEQPELTSSSRDVSIGLNQALGGMASAFLTTLFGAVLGGVFLRILYGCTECLIEEVVDQIELTTETRVVPLLRNSPEEVLRQQHRAYKKRVEQLEDAAAREYSRLSNISEHLVTITRRYARLSKSIAEAEAMLSNSKSHQVFMARIQQLLSTYPVAKWHGMWIGVAACVVIASVTIIRLVLDFNN